MPFWRANVSYEHAPQTALPHTRCILLTAAGNPWARAHMKYVEAQRKGGPHRTFRWRLFHKIALVTRTMLQSLKMWIGKYFRNNQCCKHVFTESILLQNQACASLLLTILPSMVASPWLSFSTSSSLSHHSCQREPVLFGAAKNYN